MKRFVTFVLAVPAVVLLVAASALAQGTLTVSPPLVQPGGSVQISGNGCTGDTVLVLVNNASNQPIVRATFPLNGRSGTFTGALAIPAQTDGGSYSVAAFCLAAESEVFAYPLVTLTVLGEDAVSPTPTPVPTSAPTPEPAPAPTPAADAGQEVGGATGTGGDSDVPGGSTPTPATTTEPTTEPTRLVTPTPASTTSPTPVATVSGGGGANNESGISAGGSGAGGGTSASGGSASAGAVSTSPAGTTADGSATAAADAEVLGVSVSAAGSEEELALTGVETPLLAGFGALLVIAGLIMVPASRRQTRA